MVDSLKVHSHTVEMAAHSNGAAQFFDAEIHRREDLMNMLRLLIRQ